MPSHIEYQWQGHAVSCLTQAEERHLRSGVFILATNDNDIDMQRTLDLYKSQQRVERGFRFLNSPEFLTSALFLKKPERIEALLMVMTCSLMIYAALEHRIRQGLKAHNVSIPDMKRKPTQSPTARWVFLCFSGLHELRVGDAPPIIVNLQERQHTILAVLGERYRQIYS
jgi:transposase